MSYQSFLRSTLGSTNKNPLPSIPRKPAVTPSQPFGPSVNSTVTQKQPSQPTINPSTIHSTPASSTRSDELPPASTPASIPSAPTTSPSRKSLTPEQTDAALKTCLELQKTATQLHEKRPFAALLLAPDNTTILLTHFSISHVQHAETELARLASIHFSQKYLIACTLVSTWEPCAMCTGTIYWTNIGRILYAASEAKLNDLTGVDNDENMTLSLPCREVLKAGQKDVEVIGPVLRWEERVVDESGKWWKDHQTQDTGIQRQGSVNGSVKPGSLSSVSLRQATPTTWTGENNVLSSINDEGEYTADLDIDWMR